MEKTSKAYMKNKKESFTNKKPISNAFLASILKLTLAAALFVFISIIAYADDVVVQNGNVGIGTTNPADPAEKLVVNGNARILGGNMLQLFNSDNTANAALYNGGSTDNAEMRVRMYSEDVVTITAAGNVGIGTASPTTKLDVNEVDLSATYNGIAETSNNRIGNGACRWETVFSIGDYVKVVSASGTYYGTITSFGGVSSNVCYIYFPVGTVLYNGESQTIYKVNSINLAGASGMSITKGNVGIGTTSPSKMLVIGNGATGSTFRLGGKTYTSWNYDFDTTKGDYLEVLSERLGATSFVIDSLGNVGIGTTSPSGRLEVAGQYSQRYFSLDDNAIILAKVNNNALQTMLTLENTQISAANYGDAIDFNLGYGGDTISTPGTPVGGGRIAVASDQAWSSTSTTQDSYMAFSTTVDGSLTEKVRITSAGNVGIGTTDPQAKLSISGGGLQLPVYLYGGLPSCNSGGGWALGEIVLHRTAAGNSAPIEACVCVWRDTLYVRWDKLQSPGTACE